MQDSIAKNVGVTHVSTSNGTSVFEIQLDNSTGEKFSINVQDKEGNVLFREVYQDKKFDKKFEFERLTDAGTLTFTIRILKSNQAEVFEINSNIRMVEDVTVKKL